MGKKTDTHAENAEAIARAGKEILPEGMGVLVITFDGNHGRMGYASTGKRDDCIAMLREFLNKFKGNCRLSYGTGYDEGMKALIEWANKTGGWVLYRGDGESCALGDYGSTISAHEFNSIEDAVIYVTSPTLNQTLVENYAKQVDASHKP